MGDYNTKWNATLKTKGAAAAENIRRAFSQQRKFCGFEIKPRQRQKNVAGQKKIAPQVEYFYMDRYHGLSWLPALRADHERLKSDEEFIKQGLGPPPNLAGNEVGHYFELVRWVGPAPGRENSSSAAGDATADPLSSIVALSAPPAPQDAPEVSTEAAPTEPPAWLDGWGGGESEHHKALKAYVAAHPALFGAPADAQAILEFDLLSGDRIDVVFQTPNEWVAVEVKSSISGPEDCIRGIFQVIKYRAVLKAQAAWENHTAPRSVRVLLVLEGQLPTILRPLAAKFGCDVRESVTPAVVLGAVGEGALAMSRSPPQLHRPLGDSVRMPAIKLSDDRF
jgi:hypothetical protein